MKLLIQKLFSVSTLLWVAMSPVAQAQAAARVDAERLMNADREPAQWMAVGRSYDEQRYSPLTQINSENVSKLGLTWFADLDTNRGQEASPIVIDGVLYVSTAWSKVRAFDAVSGKALWSFDPKVPPEWGVRGCCDVVNRGVAAWQGRIYVVSYDGRLIALNAKTGRPDWEVNTIDRGARYSSTGAPRIAKGKIIIGNAGAEFGVRGYVSAYDARDGKLLWRFFTVPGHPDRPYESPILREAAKTWTGDLLWKLGGGGTVWDGILFDPHTNLVYFGTGNGTPWVAEARSPQGGDNLFLNSIVAVDIDTGHYAWHYQTNPAETWDFDTTSPFVMADLDIDNDQRRVLMQASKNGIFYVLDARSGQLLRAHPYTKVTWASHIDLKTGRPVENPAMRFGKTMQPAVVQPGAQGAHSWHPMSFSRRTKLVYTPMVETSTAFAPDPNYRFVENGANTAMGRAPANLHEQLAPDAPRQSRSFLVAWDPVAAREVWRSEQRGSIASGVMTTAGGLVFQGAHQSQFSAYRDSNGEKLWSFDPQTGVVAAPISYAVNGEQYIAHLAGYGTRDYYTGNHSRLLVYKIGGTASLPPPSPAPAPRVLNPPERFGDAALLDRGERSYTTYCTICHDTQFGNRGLFPDLRYSPMINTREAFQAIVMDGALLSKGMVSFKDRFNADEAEAIRAYLTKRAQDLKAQQAASRP